MAFEIGQEVLIPCEVKQGAFSTENLVSMDTELGPVSGFVSKDQVIETDGTQYLMGVVEEILDDSLSVRLHGSFFTTSGIARFNRGNLRAA